MTMELLREYKETGDISIRNKIIEQNLSLVRFVVSRMCKKNYYEHEFNDLVGYGVFGLIIAIDKFDLNKNVKFSTFAYPKIYYTIIDELRKIDWVPRSIRFKIRRVNEEIKHIENDLGIDADVASIAKQYGLSGRDMEVLNGTCISSMESACDYLYDKREMKYDYVLR